MLSQSDVRELVHDQLLPAFAAHRKHLDWIDLWAHWQHEQPTIPRDAGREFKHLLDLAKTPWLSLVVTTVAQAMYVDGYRSPDNPDNARPWQTWMANDLDARQIALHRSALTYGTAYATVLPGEDWQGQTRARIRPVSPRRMMAFYNDPAEDDWADYAIRVEASGDRFSIRVYDDQCVYFADSDASGDDVQYIDTQEHGVGVCPVVRYSNMLDDEGRAFGEVEPYIHVARRINKTAFDRLLTQHYSSWKVRTVSGMVRPDTEDTERAASLQLRQSDLLISESPDTKFGTLDETPLEGFISAWESDIEALAAVAQVPSHNLTGKMVNLSAEALAAARASLTQKVTERQKYAGKSHAQTLRLAAHIEGDETAAQDVRSTVTWQDMEIRSMSQAVDALGKAVQMLGIPSEALWSRIPGVTKTDVDEWKALAQQADPLAAFGSMLNGQDGASAGGGQA